MRACLLTYDDRDPDHPHAPHVPADPRPFLPAITLDYGTFYNELMPSFDRRCGAARCRRTIRGTDYLGTFVERYGDHVSEHVRRARRARATVGRNRPPAERAP